MCNRRRNATIRSAVLALALCASFAAHAQPPLVVDFPIVEDHVVMASCGDFAIVDDGSGSARVTTYFDALGNPNRVTMHAEYRGTLTNSVSGYSLDDGPSVAFVSVNLVARTEMHVGTFFNVTVPGAGNVYFDAGRLVYDGNGIPIFLAGQHHAPEETLAILCAALQ